MSRLIRTLRLEILTIFLALISVSSIIILSFTYWKDSRAFNEVFHRSMHRLNTAVADRTSCLLGEYKRVPELIRGFIQQNPHVTMQSKELINYFLNLMNQQSNLSAIFLGMPNGDALVMDNLLTTSHPGWFSTDELAPKGTVFAYLLVDHSKPAGEQEIWHYLAKDFTELAVHKKPLTFNPLTRPWYEGAKKTGQFFWTDLYIYVLNQERGISCAAPIYDASNNLLGVVGTDVSLYNLSKFISAQKIGREGKAYVCDAEGKIITPTPENKTDQDFVLEAFSQLRKEPEGDSEFYLDFKNKKYLVSIHGFPLSSTKQWNIILLDPRTDLFRDILEARKEIVLISLGILLLSSFFVVYFSNRISKPIVTLSQEVDIVV